MGWSCPRSQSEGTLGKSLRMGGSAGGGVLGTEESSDEVVDAMSRLPLNGEGRYTDALVA